MWVTTLNTIVTLMTIGAMLAVLGYVAFAAGKLDASLGTLLQDQQGSRRSIERELERVRQLAQTSFPRKRESSS